MAVILLSLRYMSEERQSPSDQYLKQMQIKYKSERYPETSQQLKDIMDEICSRKHDYNTSAEVLLEGMFAARNYLIKMMGNSGFQVSYVDLNLYMMLSRWMKFGFAIVDYDRFLYPQTRHGMIRDILEHEIKFLKGEECKNEIEHHVKENNETGHYAHPNVLHYWQTILDGSLVKKLEKELAAFEQKYEDEHIE